MEIYKAEGGGYNEHLNELIISIIGYCYWRMNTSLKVEEIVRPCCDLVRGHIYTLIVHGSFFIGYD